MKKLKFGLFLVPFIFISIYGCVPLVVGAAVGALGGYAISQDTIQAETERPYQRLWSAALKVGRIRGNILREDSSQGFMVLKVDSSRVWIKLERMSSNFTRLKVSARKYHLPNLALAQDIFVKIMQEAK